MRSTCRRTARARIARYRQRSRRVMWDTSWRITDECLPFRYFEQDIRASGAMDRLRLKEQSMLSYLKTPDWLR